MRSFCVSVFITAATLTQPLEAQTSRTALAPGNLAITNVTVIPMTSDTAIPNATVVVRDGRITAVGPADRVRIPGRTRRVDGRGKFLIPGLADMHTHLYADGEEPDSVAPYELGVMIANGVTTTRLMIGTPEHLVLRREIISGRVLGPQLWVASPQFAGKEYGNTRVVTTPEEARAAVREVAAQGYDFIKLTLDISRPVYDAIVDEAPKHGMRVAGHVDPQVGLARAIEAGQQIEHLDGYFEAILADSAPSRVSVSNFSVFRLANWSSLDHMDDVKLARIAGETARRGIWTSPTLTVFNTAFAIGQEEAEIRARPDWPFQPAKQRELYLGANRRYWAPAAATMRTEARRKRFVAVRNGLVKAIADSGGKILAGSDTPEWFHVYGFALHRELASLVAAGLTPYQALEAATRNPAEFFAASADWGTIEAGKRADLVLLAANPLTDIANTSRIDAVAVGGRWVARQELDRMLRAAAERLGREAR